MTTLLDTTSSTAGRSCPLHYRYRPEQMAVDASFEAEALYVVGGLYGNRPALEEVLRLFDEERCASKRLVFNGDFHWFDTDPADFEHITSAVLSFDAIRGNVETEIADPLADDAAGCGCAYPDWVGDGVVERSNRILARLRRTARRFPDLCEQLAALPMWLRADVGGQRIAVVHGDATSLAGWGFAWEHLQDAVNRREVRSWFESARVDIFASTHTCVPVLQTWGGDPPSGGSAEQALINNGAAGMPNLAGARQGLLTRIAVRPFEGPQRRFGCRVGAAFVEALAIDYDEAAWHRQFLQHWPPGSDAHASYWQRISEGSGYSPASLQRHDG